jgi:hypothetical protein
MPAGPERRELWTEMAKLAAERLDMGDAGGRALQARARRGAVSSGALDALEKQAERDKDFEDGRRGARAARRSRPTTPRA